MRIILQRLSEIRAEQLKTRGQEQRISEVGDMYRFLDRSLTGLHLTETGFDGPESKLEEVMTSSDFTYALGEFVQRLALPAYNTKRFNFEPLVYQDTAPNYQYVTRYQQRSSLERPSGSISNLWSTRTPRPTTSTSPGTSSGHRWKIWST